MEIEVSILRRSLTGAVIALVLAGCDGSTSDSMPVSSAQDQVPGSGASSFPSTGSSSSTGGTTTGSSSGGGTSSGGVPTAPGEKFAYVGSHEGIYCYATDSTTGALASLNPALCDTGIFSGVTTSGGFLYATHVVASSDSPYLTTGTVRAYQIDSTTGALTVLSGAEISAGSNPVSIATDPTGQFVYAADYASDSVYAYAINASTGALTPVTGSPFATGHLPNWVTIDPSGAFLYTANNGSSVSGFSIDPNSGALTPVPGSPYPTTEAQSITTDPAGKFVFVATLNSTNVYAFTIDPTTGALSAVSGSPFSIGCSSSMLEPECSAGDLTVDSSGAYLYVTSNGPGTSSIVGYSIDTTSGVLTSLSGSPFAATSASAIEGIAARGGFIYVGYPDSVTSAATFAVDPTSGALTQTSTVAAANTGEDAYDFAFSP